MSEKPKVHLIELRRRNKSKKVDTGASLEVLLDGKILHGVRSIQINASAANIAMVKLEMFGAIKASTMAVLNAAEALTISEEEEE